VTLAATAAVMIEATDAPWVTVGIAGGIVIETARRAGARARVRHVIDAATAVEAGQPLRPTLVDALRQPQPFRFNAPILAPRNARVFISYTRSSHSSERWARRLRDALHAARIECYLDSFDISEGANWRTTLNRMIGEANVFIGVIERQTVTRAWPAAELETALEGARIAGQPEIILLAEPDLATSDARMLPVFAAVFRAVAPCYPRIMPLKDTTLPGIVRDLSAGEWHLPHALLGRRVSTSVMTAVAVPLAPILLIGSLGTLAAYGAAAVSALQAAGGIDLVGLAASSGAAPTVLVLSAFWAGFVARLAAASRFDVRLPSSLLASGVSAGSAKVARLHAAMALAFVVLMAQMFPAVGLLTRAWALVVAATGWLLARVFLVVTFTQRPGLERRAR
jgi:hypothetical protein